MFFIRCTLQDLAGKWSYHKQKFWIFSQVLCRKPLLLRFYLLTVSDTPTNTYLTENIGYTGFLQSSEKKCLTIDVRDVNSLRPSKLRTGAKNDKEQTYYFNYNKKGRVFSKFLAIRIRRLDSEIVFSTVNLINKSNEFKDIYYNIGDEVREFSNDRIHPEQWTWKLDKTDDMRPAIERGREGKPDNNGRISKKPWFLSR